MAATLKKMELLVLFCSILLGIGLAAPVMSIHPDYGGLTVLAKMLKPSLVAEQQFSVLTSIFHLFKAGEQIVGFILVFFTVLFPVWKLGVLWDSIGRLERNADFSRELVWVDKLGKLSMLDVFVIALLVVAVKGLPGGTRVSVEWGAYVFAFSILLSLFIPKSLHSLQQSGSSESVL